MTNRKKRPSTDADEITQAAFKRLWALWKNNQDVGDNADTWDEIVKTAAEICEQAQAAADPEFIRQFSFAVLDSLDRIAAGQ